MSEECASLEEVMRPLTPAQVDEQLHKSRLLRALALTILEAGHLGAYAKEMVGAVSPERAAWVLEGLFAKLGEVDKRRADHVEHTWRQGGDGAAFRTLQALLHVFTTSTLKTALEGALHPRSCSGC